MANSKTINNHGRTVLLFVGLLALTAFGWLHAGLAQQDARSRRITVAQSPTPPRTGNPTPTPEDGGTDVDEGEVIKVDTNLINVNVRVVDRNNRPISDVQQNEFS